MIKRIDLFPHSGKKIPKDVLEYVNKELTKKELKKLLFDSPDKGLNNIVGMLKSKQLPDNLVLSYKYSKAIADINRLNPEKITPYLPYSGIKIFDNIDNARDIIVNNYVAPYHEEIALLANKYKDALFIHWHSMNKEKSGIINVNTDESKGIRPHMQIFSRIDATGKDLSRYFVDVDEKKLYKMKLLDTVKISKCQQIAYRWLKEILKEDPEIAVDRPYKLYGTTKDGKITASSLPTLIGYSHYGEINKQFVFEIRNDIFENPASFNIIIKMIDEIYQYLRDI